MSRMILFNKGDLFDVIRSTEETIISEIDKYDENTVSKPVDELCENIYQRFFRRTPVLRVDGITPIGKGEKVTERRGYERKITYVKIEIPFDGDSELFSYRPSQYALVSIEAEVYGDKIHVLYAIDDRSSEDVRKEIDVDIADINNFLKNIESDLTKFHSKIRALAQKRIEVRKAKLMKDKEVIEGLGFPIKKA